MPEEMIDREGVVSLVMTFAARWYLPWHIVASGGERENNGGLHNTILFI